MDITHIVKFNPRFHAGETPDSSDFYVEQKFAAEALPQLKAHTSNPRQRYYLEMPIENLDSEIMPNIVPVLPLISSAAFEGKDDLHIFFNSLWEDTPELFRVLKNIKIPQSPSVIVEPIMSSLDLASRLHEEFGIKVFLKASQDEENMWSSSFSKEALKQQLLPEVHAACYRARAKAIIHNSI